MQKLSPIAQILKDYRAKYGIKQEELANELGIDSRTLRRYENNESMLTDINELRRIAGILGIDSERLGVLPDLSTIEDIDTAIDRTWNLVRGARYYEANIIVDRLIHDTANLIKTEDHNLLKRLANVQHIAGYVKSQVTRSNESMLAFAHYKKMEDIARLLDDQVLLNIALTYEGDMLQRSGYVNEAINYLEAARDTTPLADVSARGNGIQLLGRTYFKARMMDEFDTAMKQSEELAYQLEAPDNTSAKGQYNLGTVLEEYGRSYGLLGQTGKGMDYLDKADEYFNNNWNGQRRDLLIKTARTMILVRGGEISEGVKLAIEATDLCKKHGNVRLLDRIYGVQQYIDRLTREIGGSGSMLREALDGPIEY
ncbi:MAG: helix-turn-helix transcriptional regulator [Ktedonobacteraceae bacterium]|nr:helix-turn-helix transcriptional regulator [Ktedonobacteraceae bacterium]